jgi:C4-type Zn-finger protein
MDKRKWKSALVDAMMNPGYTDIDTDHPTCPQCGATMDFHGHDENGDFALGEGYWICNSCNYKVKESELPY